MVRLRSSCLRFATVCATSAVLVFAPISPSRAQDLSIAPNAAAPTSAISAAPQIAPAATADSPTDATSQNATLQNPTPQNATENAATSTNVTTSNATAPNVTAPSATAPNVTTSNATAPNVTAPNVTAPNATAPNEKTSDAGATISNSSNSVAPVVGKFLDASVPISIKVGTLGAGWQQIEINKSSTRSSTLSAKSGDENAFLFDLMRDVFGQRDGVYFTQWQTLSSGSDAFLVVYRAAPFTQSDLEKLFPNSKNAPPSFAQFMPAISRWMRDRTLTLSLLNLKTVNLLETTRPFILANETLRVRDWAQKNLPAVAEKPKVAPTQADDLRQLSLAIVQFAQDNDDVLPPMNDVAAFKKSVGSYLKNEALARAETKPFYALNPILSRKKLAHISAPRDMVTLYEIQVAPDGTRGVAFLDGQTRRLSPAQWTKFKAGSKIK